MKRFINLFSLFLFLTIVSPVFAVDIAPRISDREIIESLTQLKEGQKAANQRFDDMNRRFDDMNRRFDDLNSRLNIIIGIIVVVLGFLVRMQWQMNKRQGQMESSLETQKDEIAWLKEMINKLLPPKGIL